MKDAIKKFFRKKLNIAVVIVEALALIFLIMGTTFAPICTVVFFILQGVACILWGVRTLRTNSDITFTQQYYDELPYSVEQKKSMLKTDDKNMKNNKFTGWTFIIMGVILIFMWLSFS